MPHKAGKRYSDYIVDWEEWDIRVSRVVAIRMLEDHWEAFKHSGNVPGIAECLDYQNIMGLRPMFPLHPAAAVCPRGTYLTMGFRTHVDGCSTREAGGIS